MSKTREQLEADGVYLHGAIVPEWFKPKCDGCSVPRGARWLMKANQGHAPCVIHDLSYFVIAIAFNPGNVLREHERIKADYQLKLNRSKVARYRLTGWMFGMFYFRGVRLGGKRAINKSLDELFSKTPPTINDLHDLVLHVETYYPDLDREWFEFITDTMAQIIGDSEIFTD